MRGLTTTASSEEARPRLVAPSRPRAATTLIELMIALTVLTIGMGSILSHYATLHGLRRTTTRMSQAQEVLRSLSERFTGWDVWALGPVGPVGPGGLGTVTDSWSLPRWVGGWDVSSPADGIPDDLPPMTEAKLLQFGIIDQPLGMGPNGAAPDLQVYVEYYRYENDPLNPATRPGLIKLIDPTNDYELLHQAPATAKAGRFEAAFRANPTLVKQCRINPLIPPAEDVADQDTLVIRLITTWNGGYLETFVAKRRVPRSE